MIRDALASDILWLLEVASHAYPSGYFDPDAGRRWLNALVARPDCRLLRGERAWMGVQVSGLAYAPMTRIATTLPIASLGGGGFEVRRMTQTLVEWARSQGACRFYWSAITGTDLGPLARPLGAKPMSPHYCLEL